MKSYAKIATVIILTKNNERDMEACISSCRPFAKRILLIDDHSHDQTCGIATRMGCEVMVHANENETSQRQWALYMSNLQRDDFALFLHGHEVLSSALANEISEAVHRGTHRAYRFRMERVFLGRPIRYGSVRRIYHARLAQIDTQGQTPARLNGLAIDHGHASLHHEIDSLNDAAAFESPTGCLRSWGIWFIDMTWNRGMCDGVKGWMHHLLYGPWKAYLTNLYETERQISPPNDRPALF